MNRIRAVALTEADRDFIVNIAAPEVAGKDRLKGLLDEDEAFRRALVGDERVFEKVMADEETFIQISPGLFFEVLFRRALTELGSSVHTLERTGGQTVPVFDAPEVVQLLSNEPVLDYLAAMLASFTRVSSYTRVVRVRPHVWRRVRVNDMDLDGLIRLCAEADEENRIKYYKRIADLCLFILGFFPEHAPADHRYPGTNEQRPMVSGRTRRAASDYEKEGRRFYRLAGEHSSARITEMAEVFGLLHDQFTMAKKPLHFISTHYLHHHQQVFGSRQEH